MVGSWEDAVRDQAVERKETFALLMLRKSWTKHASGVPDYASFSVQAIGAAAVVYCIESFCFLA